MWNPGKLEFCPARQSASSVPEFHIPSGSSFQRFLNFQRLTGTIPWETTNGHEKARIITELDAVEAFLFQALNGELYGTAIRHRSSFVSLRVHSWFNCMVPV